MLITERIALLEEEVCGNHVLKHKIMAKQQGVTPTGVVRSRPVPKRYETPKQDRQRADAVYASMSVKPKKPVTPKSTNPKMTSTMSTMKSTGKLTTIMKDKTGKTVSSTTAPYKSVPISKKEFNR